MKQSLVQRIQEMKKLAAELESNNFTWEDKCGFMIDVQNDPFFVLNDGEYCEDEVGLKYA